MTDYKPNRLAGEKSPYLLQHACNPVDWYPWSREAFDQAKREDKPVFLSIGYSTCHWCHVMAHESFENAETARLMNETFISVKVDREERPDIDKIYMTVCQIMTGSGGWPLTIIMTPDKQPFFAGTYIPRETISGRIGLWELIPRVKELWKNRRVDAISSARQISTNLKQLTSVTGTNFMDASFLTRTYQQLENNFDQENGGFGVAPKFPTPHIISFLLRFWRRSSNSQALYMAEKTLASMRSGGIYDHIGYGFHRYSTDKTWLIPHFEKMLYDQALLAVAYLETYQATGKIEYSRTAREIFTYVLRDMTDHDGGFYSAEDADSEGKEGKFYLWKYQEIKEILSSQEFELFSKIFLITSTGNYSEGPFVPATGDNILYLNTTLSEIASSLGIPEIQLLSQLGTIRVKLFEYRDKRTRPHKDDKILADWNGLMIAALSLGSRILGEPSYVHAAKNAADFIFSRMFQNNKLWHRYRGGEIAVPANLDDYSFLIYGLLELYQATFDLEYLKKAAELNAILLDQFWDNVNGGFYFTSENSEKIIVRTKEIYDGAVPSGNSLEMLNLLRLGRLTGDPEFEKKAGLITKTFYNHVNNLPSAHTQLMTALDFWCGPAHEIIIVGKPDADDTRKLIQGLNEKFIPNKVVAFLPESTAVVNKDPLTPEIKSYQMVGGKATAYVCSNYKCKLPTTNTGDMMKMIV